MNMPQIASLVLNSIPVTGTIDVVKIWPRYEGRCNRRGIKPSRAELSEAIGWLRSRGLIGVLGMIIWRKEAPLPLFPD